MTDESIKGRFEARLQAYCAAEADDEARRKIEADLWERHGRRCAVFISDLAGFTRLTDKHSIVHFLALIEQCRQLVVPIIEVGGGALVKTTADNVYATFPTTAQAIEASVEAQRCVARHNADKHPDWQIGLCIGVGYGEILVIGDSDFYGHQLNLAFKLGEDIAEPGEILVTTAALADVGPERHPHETRHVLLSGITIPHAALSYEL